MATHVQSWYVVVNVGNFWLLMAA